MDKDDEFVFRIVGIFFTFFLAIFVAAGIYDYKLSELKVSSAAAKSVTKREYRMTKKQLLDSLKDLSDDAEIYVEAVSDDFDIDHTADFVEVKNIESGNDVENEATIVAYF